MQPNHQRQPNKEICVILLKYSLLQWNFIRFRKHCTLFSLDQAQPSRGAETEYLRWLPSSWSHF